MGRSAPRVGPHHTSQPRQDHAAWRVLRRPSAATPWCDTRAGRTPQDTNALSKTFQSRRRRPVAVLLLLTFGRRRRENLAVRWPTSQPAKSALCGACSAVRRPILHGAIRARDARYGVRTSWSIPFESLAANPSRCRCNRAPADEVGRSAPRVDPQHNHAKSVLCGACSAVRRPILPEAKLAGRAPRNSDAAAAKTP